MLVLKRLIFLTGQPGVGKTSILLKVVDELKKKGYKIGGMISSEARLGGIRVGFEIIDIHTGRKGWLAHADQATGPRVGRYRVNRNDLDALGANSILEAEKNADVIVADEIGPMELFSSAFRQSIVVAIKSGKPLLGVIHQTANDPLITAVKVDKNTEILEVTNENREGLCKVIIDMILQLLQNPKKM